jgi:hypothetical protein
MRRPAEDRKQALHRRDAMRLKSITGLPVRAALLAGLFATGCAGEAAAQQSQIFQRRDNHSRCVVKACNSVTDYGTIHTCGYSGSGRTGSPCGCYFKGSGHPGRVAVSFDCSGRTPCSVLH